MRLLARNRPSWNWSSGGEGGCRGCFHEQAVISSLGCVELLFWFDRSRLVCHYRIHLVFFVEVSLCVCVKVVRSSVGRLRLTFASSASVGDDLISTFFDD